MLLLLACTGIADRPDLDSTRPSDSNEETGDTGDPPLAPLGFEGLDVIHARNVIVVHVDTLRADHLPLYGYERDTLPKVGGLPWMIAEDYYALDSWTLPSTTTVMTGLTPLDHGVLYVHEDGTPNGSPITTTLADVLSAAGIHTYLAMGNSAARQLDFLTQGFDIAVGPDATSGQNLTGLAVATGQWIDSLPPGEPFFAFLQPMDVHGPYRPGSHLGTWADEDDIPFDLTVEEAEQLASFTAAYAEGTAEEQEAMLTAVRDVYDECILNMDDGLDHLISLLAERRLLDDTLIILSADHGETIGESEEFVGFGHGGTTRPELTRVPLAFLHPRLQGQTVSGLGQNTDLAPTITQIFGVEGLTAIDGKPLQDPPRTMVRMATMANNRSNLSVSDLGATDGTGMLRWSCRWQDTWRYDLETDPWGLVPIERDQTPGIEELEAELQSFEAEFIALGAPQCFRTAP